MKLNRKELRKIQYDFNSYSNRLLQANYKDYKIKPDSNGIFHSKVTVGTQSDNSI